VALRFKHPWSDHRRWLLIVAGCFVVLALWGILTVNPKDHALDYGILSGCGLLVAVVMIGGAIQRRSGRKRDTV
jgi:hypothetical protein